MRVKIQVFLQLVQQNLAFARRLEGFRPESALAKGKSGVVATNQALMRTYRRSKRDQRSAPT